MRSFKNFKEALAQKKREARSRMVKHKRYQKFKFITARLPDLILCDSDGRFDSQYEFRFTKKNIIEFVDDLCKLNILKERDSITISYDQRYDLYNNLKREGDIKNFGFRYPDEVCLTYEGYVPQVDFVELDIWNSEQGWLF
tara:strand:- start:69 stop:491 length:423 start_codon:yes stop_codon:yes gene_type:complete